jgi:dihydrofolate reductase
MRKIIVYMATSADGYIARRNGAVDWLDRPRIAGDYGMAAFYKSIDTVLMGRKTYEVGLEFGQESYPGKKNYVFSRTRAPGRRRQVEFVRGDAGRFGAGLRQAKGKGIWLVGGAELIGAFLDAEQIDEFIIHVVPTMIGDGIPLIRRRKRTVALSLLSTRRFSDGVVRLHYAVEDRRRKRRKTA